MRSRQFSGGTVSKRFSESGSSTGETPVRNRLLCRLGSVELGLLRPRLESVVLRDRQSVLLPGEPAAGLYFVESGIISMIASLEDGARIEVGMVGHEGVAGLSVLLGAETSALEGLVQMEGSALRLPAAGMKAALAEVPGLMGVLLRYVDSFQFQVAQSAACNGRHEIVQRLARWLLVAHDRVDGDTFKMTHEFMSTMLGVRRPGVTIAIGALQKAGLVEHSRGSVRVLDRGGLEAASCECYEVVKRRFAWIDA